MHGDAWCVAVQRLTVCATHTSHVPKQSRRIYFLRETFPRATCTFSVPWRVLKFGRGSLAWRQGPLWAQPVARNIPRVGLELIPGGIRPLCDQGVKLDHWWSAEQQAQKVIIVRIREYSQKKCDYECH